MLTEGMFIADRYEIVGKVGAGGMSDVFKAKDHILGRNVAIKVLKKEFSEDRNFVVKFRTEAQSAAGLEHPNIVNIYDVGSEENFHYIVMEYVEGITLKTYIEKKGQLSFKEAVSIAIQVARGIEAAHNKNIIHRDIKPQNIIISTEGKVKVTDFGIAKAISSNTVSSDVMGSVHYTSPEHARNAQVDGRSDIYSLGIVMYEMVTGRVPFDGDTTVSVAIQHLQEEMVQPSAYATSLPISMEKIILKCCQKNPDRRYQTIGELLNDLVKALKSPNEDFVVIAAAETGPTKVITQDELKEIKEQFGDEDEELDDEFDEDAEDDEEDDEDEAKGLLNPKMNRAVTIMFIAISVIIVVLIIYIIGSLLGLFRFGHKKTPDPIPTTQTTATESDAPFKMIDLTGMTIDEATKKLEELGLTLTVSEQVESDEYAPGTILGHTPDRGDEVKKGDVIEVTIVKGENIEYIEVPNVIGESEKSAKKAIEDAGLECDKDYESSNDVEAGKVITQSPRRGKVIKGTKVKITISKGKENVKVPNVVGKSAEDARNALEALGFDVDIKEEYSDSVAADKVIRQSEDADKEVSPDTTITITVSKGKDPATEKPKEEPKTLYTFTKEFTAPSNAVKYSFTLKSSDGKTLMTKSSACVGDETLSFSKSDIESASGEYSIEFTLDDDTTNSESDTVSFTKK